MAIHFKMVAKQNNIATPPETKYFPCAVHQGEVDLEQLAETIAAGTSMTKADCYGVVISLTQAIGNALSQGQIVKIMSLGTFQITLQGTGAESPEPLGKSNVKGAKIIYKPAKNLQDKLKGVEYKRLR